MFDPIFNTLKLNFSALAYSKYSNISGSIISVPQVPGESKNVSLSDEA